MKLQKERPPKSNTRFTNIDIKFLKKITNDLDCFYHYSGSGYIVSLKNNDSTIRRKMRVFGYLHKNKSGYYWLTTPKTIVDTYDEAIYTDILIKWKYYPKLTWNEDGIWFTITPNYRMDYSGVIKSLKRIARLYP